MPLRKEFSHPVAVLHSSLRAISILYAGGQKNVCPIDQQGILANLRCCRGEEGLLVYIAKRY